MKLAPHARSLLAADVGLSLAFVQAIAHQHLTPSVVAFDIGVAHAVYGRDRLIDLMRTDEVDGRTARAAAATTALSFAACVHFLCTHQHAEAVPWLSVLGAYTRLKPRLGLCKPLFIGASWAYAATAVPGTFALAPFLYYTCMFGATSSVLDVKDVADDAARNVTTLPVTYGAAATYAASAAVAATSLGFHGVDSWLDLAFAAFGVWCSIRATYDDDDDDDASST